MSRNVQKIYDTFLEVCKTGPVLLLAPMADPSHSNTQNPIHQYSPLLRLAIAAANLGITKVTFDPNGEYVAILGTWAGSRALRTLPEVLDVPGLFLHWCTLNGMFFDEGVSWGRRISKTSITRGNSSTSRISRNITDCATLNPTKKTHRWALRQVKAHFISMAENYQQAARRVERVLRNEKAKKKVSSKKRRG